MQQAACPELAAANGTQEEQHTRGRFWPLVVGTIGVVYGDIGTSPLYTIRESVNAAVGTGGEITREIVFGVLSLGLFRLVQFAAFIPP